MSQNKNSRFHSFGVIFAVLSLLFITIAFSSPLGTPTRQLSNPPPPPSAKMHFCGHRLKEVIIQVCKIFNAGDNLNKNDVSEESDSAYYDSSSEEGSREKRSVPSNDANNYLITNCCVSGCNKNDILKYCMTEFSASQLKTITTTKSSLLLAVAESESQESNESTVEEEESSQTDVETTTSSGDLIIFQNNRGQLPLPNTISSASGIFLNRYSYHTPSAKTA